MVDSINYHQLLNKVRHDLSLREEMSDDRVMILIDDHLASMNHDYYMGVADRMALRRKLFNAIRRLDILQPLVDDQNINEIMINGHKEVLIEKHGRIIKIDEEFDSEDQLMNVIQRIVSRVNRVVNESQPICDARLQDGSRISVVLPPISLKGPIVTIRKFPEKPIEMEQIIEGGMISRRAAEFLTQLVNRKYNIFICGGTGSGKTTFLNALSSYIPKEERIITIEDSAELRLSKLKNLVSLETRNANVEGKGEITIKDLIKASLRMRPDRIIVGEVRGAEAADMLQAMNTGHAGSMSTGHANSTRDMLIRLETMVLQNAHMPLEAIRQQIGSAIDIMVYLSKTKDRGRQVVEIMEIAGYRDGKYLLNTIFRNDLLSKSDRLLKIGSLQEEKQV